MKKNIAIITNADKHSGVGSRAYQLASHIGDQEDIAISVVVLDGKNNTLRKLPGLLGSKSISWIRLARSLPPFNLYDLSNQTLSFIAKKRKPNILTVDDIIELTNPQEPKAFYVNKYLMSGITQADRIVAVSEYTKKQVQEYFQIPASRITVIPNGVDEAFHAITNYKESIAYQELLQDFGLIERNPIILSVGSEHPRKNMKTILHTIALLKKDFPNILLVKVGDTGLLSGRKETLDTIDNLGLKANVKLVGTIATNRLNELYNIADALIFPSYNEGFGMTPLEAMAAQCPVLCSNTTSLPEVVGDGAIMHNPDDADAFAKSVTDILRNTQLRDTLVQKGSERTKQFSWKKAAEQTLALYRTIV